ncbi:MarR family winged helix-turn-helix transcriptional regulator [Salinibacterium sp. ZJ450]|uniref:MarR family winged helix-turn-helix transcriptional regulator n=1 Tax=Salinibacterium sp. ZJ450 TaxID=2708338 RepID=UPI0014201007|nr:MarR family transcriptional regulator [Salinibacterium sp. ZJ450]
MTDYIDKAQAQWAQIQPGLDTEPAGIIGRIARLAQLIETRTDRVLEELDVTRSEFDILALLTRSGRPMTPSEISANMLCSAAGTTKRMKKLLDAGLITRETNPSDGRGALIQLTDAGQAKTIPVLRAVLDVEARLLEALPADDCERLTAQLRALLTSLEAAGSR